MDTIYPAYAYIGKDLNLKPKDVLAISRSCDSRSLKILGGIMQSLVVIDHATKAAVGDTSIKSIPLSLPNQQLFSCLSALISKGVIQSKLGAAVMAMIAVYKKEKILFNRAFQFLIEMRGTWFDFSSPENYSYEFIKFARKTEDIMQQHGGSALADNEKVLFDDLFKIGGWKINGSTNIDIESSYSSNKTVRWNWKSTSQLLYSSRRRLWAVFGCWQG